MNQNDFEYLMDMIDLGKMSAAEANVEMVLTERVRLVTSPLPREVRRALNDAVKSGKLGHIKRRGIYPEAYYHPTFEYLAKAAIKKRASEKMEAISKVIVSGVPENQRDNV